MLLIHLILRNVLTIMEKVNPSVKMTAYDHVALKNIAYLTLSDMNMIGNKVVKVIDIASKLHIDGFEYASELGALGSIGNTSQGVVITVSDNLSELEQNFEKATLLSAAILYDLKNTIPLKKRLIHKVGSVNFKSASTLASLLLAYKLSDREIKLFMDTKFEKKVSLLAHKKGLPTAELLKRAGQEM